MLMFKQLVSDTVGSCRTDCSVAAAAVWLQTAVCASVDSAAPSAAAAAVVAAAWLPDLHPAVAAAGCRLDSQQRRQHLTVDLVPLTAGHSQEADHLHCH